jgi:hypothetical protein
MANLIGPHLSVAVDYEVEDVPGFGTLPVGVRETRPEALEAALAPGARPTFIRIKNSWGENAADARYDGGISPKYLPEMPGYNDLYVEYLDLPYDYPVVPRHSHLAIAFVMPNELRFPIPPSAP